MDYNNFFYTIIERILEVEGGYNDDKYDRGGKTKYGISQKAYPNLNIEELTKEDAREIYKNDYWDKIRGDNINSIYIAYLLLDTAINLGVHKASILAQEVLGVTADGIVGGITISAINNCNEELFIAKYKLKRIEHYATLCTKDRTQKRFLLNWVTRTLNI